MSRLKFISLCLALLSLSACGKAPDLVIFSGESLAKVKKDFKRNPSKEEYVKLIDISDKLLDVLPNTVMEKNIVPPSGDKHDYISQGPYWWPNPDTPDGLPYIRRDGEKNPETKELTDYTYFGRLVERVGYLSTAYYFTRDEKYAQKAADLMRFWFIYPRTMMNPNLNFAQRVPGRSEGRGIGIIDFTKMNYLYDYVRLLEGSKAWDAAKAKGFKQWVEDFTEWLVTSENGRQAQQLKNNHGTYYDLLVCTSYMFIGQREKAAAYALQSMPQRFDEITAEGATPRELSRTRAWNYSLMNLRGLLCCATVAEKVGVDMWHYVNVNGATIQTALDWYKPYVLEGKAWDYKDITNCYNPSGLLYPLAVASSHCDISAYSDLVKDSDTDSFSFFFYPEL